jgi:hypothetical protein
LKKLLMNKFENLNESEIKMLKDIWILLKFLKLAIFINMIQTDKDI